MEKNYHSYQSLPRGGFLIDSPIGYIQLGAPPETIKDTMMMEKNVPRIFVLPENMFSWNKGISIAEIEFPLYYNFFIRKKKTFIICTEEQFSRMKIVLQESLFGPKEIDLSADFTNEMAPEIPDIEREMSFFRNNLKLSDLVAFGLLKNNKFTIQGVTISLTDDGDYIVSKKEEEIAHVPGNITYNPTFRLGQRLSEPYTPPLFAVTCLGPSHGFDPNENTSGFILWLNHQGVMVDPPVNSTEWLESSNVSPKFINSIILTHCHADHDAGTFQKILEEGKITIYSTETVMRSFINKYSALSGIDSKYLMNLFDFHPIKIGEPIYINSARFEMFYTLHSIPTLGFKMRFQDKSFVYSSDHNNDPEVHQKLLDMNLISRGRYEELRDFPWDCDVIYHESGVPPLHTPITYLNSMDKKQQKKIVVYHIAEKDFPQKTHLTLAKFGMENTLTFKAQAPQFEDASQILSTFKQIDFFYDMPIHKSQEFISIVEVKKYKRGDVIIRKGTTGDSFYIIYSGNISIDSGGLKDRKIYGPYDYFGEVALVTDQKRAVNVIAETDVTAFCIEKFKFLNFIVNSEFERTLKRLAEVRSSETWNLLSENPFMRQCTAGQKTWLESLFIPMDKNPGTLIKEGETIEYIYIIQQGSVEVHKNGSLISILKRGDFAGTMLKVHRDQPAEYSFINKEKVSLYAMKAEDIYRFVDRNPGILMKLVYNFDD